MQTSTINSAVRQLAAKSITGYQKYISPHKGFSCAHRVLYGGESCSQFFKRVILEEGITGAVQASKWRFQACREANQILKARRDPANHLYRSVRCPRQQAWLASTNNPGDAVPNEESVDNDSLEENEDEQSEEKIPAHDEDKQNIADTISDGCDCLGEGANVLEACGDLSGDCNNINCNGIEALDCRSFDCSGLDCNGADCGSCDCGGGDCGSCG